MRLVRQFALLTTLGCGLFTGYVSLVPLSAVMRVQPTTAAWDASACPAGTYTVQALAVDGSGQSFLSDPVTVTLPAASVPVTWTNLAPGSYTAKATASNGTGLVWESASQPVTGLGTPAPTPTATPTPTSKPAPNQSPDCTLDVTVTDGAGAVWTIDANAKTLKNGQVFGNGAGKKYLYSGGVVFVLGTDTNWYRAGASGWTNLGPTQPACNGATVTPTPTATPTPTVTPTTQPTPVDLSPVLAKLDQIIGLVTPVATPTPTVTPAPALADCKFYTGSNGTSVYIQCKRTDFPTAVVGGAVKVIK